MPASRPRNSGSSRSSRRCSPRRDGSGGERGDQRPTGRPERRGGRGDRDVLDITAGLIARRGIKDTAVQAVADQAGYSKAGILARFTRALRGSSAVDQRSGVSARFAIAGAETISAAAVHRAARQGEEHAVARPIDLETAVDVLGGKIEFENGEEDRADEVLEHLLRTATAETVRSRFRGLDFAVLVEALDGGTMVTTGEQVSARAFLEGLPSIGESDLYDQVCERLGATNDGERAGAIEAAFTVLALHNRVAPPTINLTEQDPEIVMDVATAPRELPQGDLLAVSNSFGFGGHT
ncbi:TetR family transcriptional regulator, partial [Bacillus sp. S34]|nr:TetR family transcriptional regulator [Bacillus sp. S34]